MGMIKGAIEREGTMETSDSSEAGTLGASGNDQDNQGGDVVNGDVGVFWEGSMRRDSPMLSSFLVVCDYHYDDPFIFYYS